MSKRLPVLVPAMRPVRSPVAGTLFERRPITLDGFTLRARAAVAVGKPTIRQWQAAFEFACASEDSAPCWTGSLLVYAETREDWKAKMDQAIAVTGLSKQTLENRATVVRKVAEAELELAPTFAHASEVASLPRVEQTKFLEAARSHNWTTRELRSNIRTSQRAKVIEGRADHCYTIEVNVVVDVTAANHVRAEEAAWDLVKRAVQSVAGAKVIAAHARKESA